MTCENATISLGLYVVESLDPAERAEIDAHLRDCARCRAELAELAELPSVLGKLRPEDVNELVAVAPAPEDLFARVAAEARLVDAAGDRRRRPRWQSLAAAAAAVVVIGGVSVTAVEVMESSNRPETVSAVQGPVHMSVALTSQATGTAVRITVSGLAGDEHCRLIAMAKDGTTDLVSQWTATYAGDAQFTGSTAIAAGDLTRLVLLGHDGSQLVAVSV